jgi:hypothetical protein
MGHLGIIEVDHQSADSILINFTDGTYASFSVEDLAALHPRRSIAAGDIAEAGQDYL